jgi:putative (di)nucleoside polyphosphate hydrolase
MAENTKKSYRPNVAAVILSPKYPENCKVFIASRIDMDGAWQFPQGGIDEGENPKEALFRELKEEIGTDDIKVIAEYPKWISYDFPENIAKKMYPYDGQIQKYFLVKLNSTKDINLNTEEAEFNDYEFVDYYKIYDKVTYFKKSIYREVLDYFRKEGFL